MATRSRLLSVLSLLSLMVLGSAIPSPVQAEKDPDPGAYGSYIRQAHADLESGKPQEARAALEKTDRTRRNFEFDYLLARAEKPDGGAAGSPDLVRSVSLPDVEVRYGVLNELERQVVYICRDGSLRVYDLAAPDKPLKSVAHPGGSAVWSGEFSHDGKTFLSGHQNGELLVWDAAKWEVRHTVPIGEAWPVRELAVGPDGLAFVAENKQELELWQIGPEGPKKIAGVGPRYNFGEGLAFSPAGDLVATGGMFDILLHDAKTGAQVHSLSHASYTMGLEFSPDGKSIASAPRGNVNRFLAVFDVKGTEPRFNAGPFGHYVAGMSFTPDGKRIVATGCEKLLRIFDAETGEIILQLPRPECSSKPAFTRDGRLLGWSEPAGYRFIDLGKGEEPDRK